MQGQQRAAAGQRRDAHAGDHPAGDLGVQEGLAVHVIRQRGADAIRARAVDGDQGDAHAQAQHPHARGDQ